LAIADQSTLRHLQPLASVLFVVAAMTQCPTCGADPCANPSFCKLCRKADERLAAKRTSEDQTALRARRLLDDSISLDRAYWEFNTLKDRAAESTVEALMYSLRSGGALEEPGTKRRLFELSDSQVIEVGNRLQKLRPEIARAWTTNEVEILFQARTKK
jgi:hypothetical protein